MKKVLIAAAFLASFSFAFAQDKMQDNDLKTWYHKDFSTTNVYGVNTDNAYKFLESKGLKPRTVVVGVLDSGVEVDHPGLINNMWKNPNEIPNNGIDDDKNGYVDDIYGWNFIGGKTADVDADNLEVTRMVKKYQPIFEGTDSAKNRANQAKMPEEYAIYQKSKKLYDEKGSEAKQYYHYFSGFNNAIPSIVKTLNGKTLTKANLAAIKPASQEDSRNLQILNSLVQDAGNVGKTPKEVEELLRKEIEGALKHYESQATKHYNLDFDPRAEIVGDNYDNYNEKHYGNNHYEGPDASHGTHVSGIIAGLPHGNEAQYGVAHKVAKIMTVRAVPDGDERDKDVANAIRYAVDNGAKILNMSFGKAVSPGKKHVWDAMKYAEKKGVLLVKAAGNDNQNIGENEYFPTNFMKQSDEKPFVSNMIVVGASTNNSQNLRARFSNYNGKMVDVFAPGQEIYSTVPDAKYEYLQGTSMASPVVAGAAAVLWAYMPSLTPQQIKEALVKTVNKSTVNANVDSNANFDQISVAGGVIDLYKAAQYAYDNFYNKKGVKANRKAVKSK
ncbi:MAG: S8 family serine peptidase [Flavobacteriaceae bacterium]|nr:S8 family serine peptidase [Flavobacteriaceae bacterium]